MRRRSKPSRWKRASGTTPILAQLLKTEVAEREVRSIACHIKVTRFPAYKDLPKFDFSSSEMNEATVHQLHRGEFMEGVQNVILIHCPAGHTPASDGPFRRGRARNPN